MTRRWPLALALAAAILWGIPPGAAAQTPDAPASDTSTAPSWHEEAWTEITTHRGLRFSYIFYSKADTRNNGVVIRLDNQNAHPIRYAFTVIFRTPTAERTAQARGSLDAGAMKTGEKDGLFWIPFREEGQTIGEIGLRGIRVVRASPQASGS
jgi:hypothetical protein